MQSREPVFSAIVVTAVLGCLLLGCVSRPEGKAPAEAAKDADQSTAAQTEVTGQVTSITPCRTLMELELPQPGEEGSTTRLRFITLDPAVRESAKGIGKGDTVKVWYTFSPDAQRNQVERITKVAGAGETLMPPAPQADPPGKQNAKSGVARGTVIAASANEIRLRTAAGEEAVFNVLRKVSEQAAVLKDGDGVEVSYKVCPGGCCIHPWVTSLKRL